MDPEKGAQLESLGQQTPARVPLADKGGIGSHGQDNHLLPGGFVQWPPTPAEMPDSFEETLKKERERLGAGAASSDTTSTITYNTTAVDLSENGLDTSGDPFMPAATARDVEIILTEATTSAAEKGPTEDENTQKPRSDPDVSSSSNGTPILLFTATTTEGEEQDRSAPTLISKGTSCVTNRRKRDIQKNVGYDGICTNCSSRIRRRSTTKHKNMRLFNSTVPATAASAYGLPHTEPIGVPSPSTSSSQAHGPARSHYAADTDVPKNAFPRISRPVELMRSSYDCVVIGSGYGGGVAAARMARAGQSVCLLELGKERWPGEYPASPADAFSELHCSGELQPSVLTGGIGVDNGRPTGMYHLIFGKGQNAVVANGEYRNSYGRRKSNIG